MQAALGALQQRRCLIHGDALGEPGRGGLKLGRKDEGSHCCPLHWVYGAWTGLEDPAVTNLLLSLPRCSAQAQQLVQNPPEVSERSKGAPVSTLV